MFSRFITILALGVALVNAAVAEYDQCNGIGWTAPKECAAGLQCVVINYYYSQCLRPPTTSTPTSTSKTRTVPSTCTAPASRSTGFLIKAITPGTPVYNLNLQISSPTDDLSPAVLNTDSGSPGWSFTDGTIGYVKNLACDDYYYLNFDDRIGVSYHFLTFRLNLNTSPWWKPYNATEVIGTRPDAPFGEASDFLACNSGGLWKLYLQTGTDLPPDLECYVTKLKVSTGL